MRVAVSAACPCLRSARERALQTLCFEGLGLLLIAPLYGAVAGGGTGHAFALIAAMSLVMMAWAWFYNTVFDWFEWRCTARVASARPHAWRCVHALMYEATGALVSCPVIVAMTGLGWVDAFVVDMALTLAYAGYGYAFHWGFDRLRPVRRSPPVN